MSDRDQKSKMEMDMENETSIFLNPLLLVFASLGYCFILVPKIPTSKLKALSLLPIFYIFSLLPWCFSSILFRCISSFFITWITSFKLLLFCFNRGPLVTCKSYVDFVVIAIFPAKIKENPPPVPNSSLYLELLINVAGLVLLVVLNFLISVVINLPPNLILLLYVVSIFLGFYVLMTCGFILTRAMVARYELVRVMNKPYLATSLQDFWGRRWNRMSSDILRLAVYDPTRESLTGIIGVGIRAKVVAVIATLVVSGIMHELVFYYITCGMKPSWEVTWFFVLHGLCMVLESGWKYGARTKGWTPINPIVSMVLTVGFVILTFYWLLILPVWRSGQSKCEIGNSYVLTRID